MPGEVRSDRKLRVELSAPFDGWFAEMKLHVPFKMAILLESDKPEDRVNAIRSLIVGHNFREEVGYEEILDDPTDAPDDAIDQLLTKWAAVKGALPSA
jgi:hypothetical protein